MSSLYIHIPFCKNKCLYCDFPSFHGKDNFMDNYIDALCKEIEVKSTKEISTIFIGGGTPTYLDVKNIEKLGKVLANLRVAENLEFTVEGNPGTFTREKLLALKEMGVNRLSIGLQAFQNTLLKKIGRIHRIEDFIKSYNLAREVGFNNINVDIMFGLPDQTLEMWVETLNEIIKLNPEHISAYSLIIEEGTPFYSMDLEEKLKLPSEDTEREMYRKTKEILEKNNYFQYEISNFSKEGKQCRHNLVYWDLNEYIGCGSAAHSFIENKRISNTEDIKVYIDKMREKNDATEEIHMNSRNESIEEFMFMGLRKINGVSIKEFYNRFNIDINCLYKDVIEKFINNGLLLKNRDNLRLSDRGVELSNIVMQEFLI